MSILVSEKKRKKKELRTFPKCSAMSFDWKWARASTNVTRSVLPVQNGGEKKVEEEVARQLLSKHSTSTNTHSCIQQPDNRVPKNKFVDWERPKRILGRENWFPPWGSSSDECSPFFAFYFFLHFLIFSLPPFLSSPFTGHPPPQKKKKSTVKLFIEAALELKPHFLQTQVAHKPHSNKSRSSCRRCRTKSYHFSHAKMFVFFWTNSQHLQGKVTRSFCMFWTALHGFCRLRTLHMPPSNKSRSWIEATPKSWKIAHKSRLLYTTFSIIFNCGHGPYSVDQRAAWWNLTNMHTQYKERALYVIANSWIPVSAACTQAARTTIAEQGKARNSVLGGKMAGLLCR